LGIVLVFGAAAAAENFYAGKTVRLIVGSSPGGGFDAYARIIARHIGKYIPGHPATLVQNMPGAGNLIAANYMFNKAKPDGLTIGHFVGQLILQQALGREGIKFDGRQFEWIGVVTPDYNACVLSKSSGVDTIQEWLAATQPVKLGGMGPGTSLSDMPRLLHALLGLPIQLIEGYGGAARVRLAVEKGEVQGGCWNVDVIRRFWADRLASGEVKIVVQASIVKHPDIPDVPSVMEFARTDEDRQLLRVATQNTAKVLRSFSLPPGTPKERVELLRKAFMATMKDPEFLAETKKAGLVIDPISGQEVAGLVDEFFELKPEYVTKLKKILVPGKP